MDFNDEYVGQEPDGAAAVAAHAVPDHHSGRRRDYIKLSPTQIRALTCPAEYWYRYVENLESRKTPSFLAFGKAIHKAIEAAYARQKTPMTPEEVADVAEHSLRVVDKNGIAYKDGEALDDHIVMKKKSRKKDKDAVEKPVTIPGLVTEARRLATIWWITFQEHVRRVENPLTEVSLEYALDADTVFRARLDVVERLDGLLCIGDHKTAKKWGAAQEREAALATQKYLECWLWWKCRHEIVDRFYWTIAKKTKEPEVFQYWSPAPTRDELIEYEDSMRAYAAIARHYKRLGRPVRAAQMKCSWCSFAPLCLNVDGAREMFVNRDERRKLESKPADDVDDDLGDAEE